jgi:PST family polysaccharide transporter
MTTSTDTLAARTAAAGQWRLAATFLTTALQVVVGVVLARLLTPADFGVMALALVVHGLFHRVGDLGIGVALVQRPRLSDAHVRTAFTVSVLLGIGWAIVLAASAPAIASVVREPRVTPVLRLLSAGFVFVSAGGVAGALLRRQLDFRGQFFVDAASHLLGYGVVAIALAAWGWGVWSLAWGALTQLTVGALAQLAWTRHAMRPLLSGHELRELLAVGLGAALSGGVNYAALNGDNVVVGRLLGAFSLGIYVRAYALMNVPFTYVTAVMSSVLFPAFARMQEDPARLRAGYLRGTRLASMIAASAMATLAVGAPHLVPAIYGAQWIGAVVPLQVLCAAGYFRALYHLGGVTAQSVGRVYAEMANQVGYAALVILGASVGARAGLPGVAAGVGLAILFMFVASGHLAVRATGVSWSDYWTAQRAGLLTAAVTGTSALGVRLVMEQTAAGTITTSVALLAGAAVPWAIGTLWILGEPGFESLRHRLPPSIARAGVRLRERL